MSALGRVFMLDDDKIFLELYQNLLEAKGYDVFATDNAYKFLMYGRELHPDIMFLDLNMPEMNGWDVLARIAEDQVLSEIPVAMLTVSRDEDLATVKGVAHFLHKPVDYAQMSEILESYCQGRKNHDFLLIQDYEPLFAQMVNMLKSKNHSCFSTHSVKAAKRYLKKNKPKKIAVKLSDEAFEKAQNYLEGEELIKVNGLHDLENLLDDSA